MHPLLYETMTNRRAALLAAATALLVAGAVLGYQVTIGQGVAGALWIKTVLGTLFYPPLAINAWIDARRHVLLKNWTHLAGVVALIALLWMDATMWRVLPALLVAVPMWAVSWLSRGRLMGRGDARLIVVLSLWNEVWHPWGALAVVIVSFALHTVYVVWRAFTCRITLHTRHALGPWLVAGSGLVFVFMA